MNSVYIILETETDSGATFVRDVYLDEEDAKAALRSWKRRIPSSIFNIEIKPVLS